MTPATATAQSNANMERPLGWLSKSEAWLDSKGKGAWIAAMVLGFVFFWPVGLALLAYMIWSKRMFGKSCNRHARHHSMRRSGHAAMKSSGNTAFDTYKGETLHRLEQEQEAFEAFLQRLRDAKDKSEFDDFMDDRARRADQDAKDRNDQDEDARESA